MSSPTDQNRRDFIKKALATGASGLFMSSAIGRTLAQMEGPADLVVRNAKVSTIRMCLRNE